jgi:hypothetical protein
MPRIVEHHLPGVAQHRRLAGTIEQRDAECRFERLHRLADGRLHAAETTGSGGEATALRYGDEGTKLVEG